MTRELSLWEKLNLLFDRPEEQRPKVITRIRWVDERGWFLRYEDVEE